MVHRQHQQKFSAMNWVSGFWEICLYNLMESIFWRRYKERRKTFPAWREKKRRRRTMSYHNGDLFNSDAPSPCRPPTLPCLRQPFSVAERCCIGVDMPQSLLSRCFALRRA
nr:hypothetical protein Itr_chr06CG19760 [Ipomoea trifida]